MRVLIIANPIAGGGRGVHMAEAIARELTAQGLSPHIFTTRQAGDAREQAAQPGFECVVAVGGDGTLNEVANGLAGADTLLAILPLGTANVVARELGLAADPRRLAKLIAQRSVRTIDVGRFADRRFLLGVGAGPDAAVVEEVHRARGKRLSYASYVVPVCRVLRRYAFPPIAVEVNGKLICDDAGYVVVGNCRCSAGVFAVTPHARLDDGLLDVCICRNLNALRLVSLALATSRANFTKHKDIIYVHGEAIILRSASGVPIPLQVDGDPAGCLPAMLTCEPAAVRVVAPPQAH